jgi:hypothetical protein
MKQFCDLPWVSRHSNYYASYEFKYMYLVCRHRTKSFAIIYKFEADIERTNLEYNIFYSYQDKLHNFII